MHAQADAAKAQTEAQIKAQQEAAFKAQTEAVTRAQGYAAKIQDADLNMFRCILSRKIIVSFSSHGTLTNFRISERFASHEHERRYLGIHASYGSPPCALGGGMSHDPDHGRKLQKNNIASLSIK